MSPADIEGEWFVQLAATEKTRFLSRLGHSLTIAGREAYEVGGPGLTDAPFLRCINEIQHRVLACLSSIIGGVINESLERSIAHWVFEPAEARVREKTTYAWQRARESFRGANA
jgi:hypothetical protein